MANNKKLVGIALLGIGLLNLGIYTIIQIPPILNGLLVFAGSYLWLRARR